MFRSAQQFSTATAERVWKQSKSLKVYLSKNWNPCLGHGLELPGCWLRLLGCNDMNLLLCRVRLQSWSVPMATSVRVSAAQLRLILQQHPQRGCFSFQNVVGPVNFSLLLDFPMSQPSFPNSFFQLSRQVDFCRRSQQPLPFLPTSRYSMDAATWLQPPSAQVPTPLLGARRRRGRAVDGPLGLEPGERERMRNECTRAY
jgi:hypothetical protein